MQIERDLYIYTLIISNLTDDTTMSNLSPSPNKAEMINNLPKAHFWLERRALESAITRRYSPHIRHNFLVPSIVSSLSEIKAPPFDPYDASAPRLFHAHVPYSLLPDSVKSSACKIIYITRNPKDTVVSMWHFFNSIKGEYPLEETVDCFCSGDYLYGSFFDHVVEYWTESKRRPEKILFLKYDELKSDPKGQISRISEFLGKADQVEVDEIIRRCSLERLKNKNGGFKPDMPNRVFGDCKNYLTPEMEERIDQISRIKLQPFGLFL